MLDNRCGFEVYKQIKLAPFYTVTLLLEIFTVLFLRTRRKCTESAYVESLRRKCTGIGNTKKK